MNPDDFRLLDLAGCRPAHLAQGTRCAPQGAFRGENLDVSNAARTCTSHDAGLLSCRVQACLPFTLLPCTSSPCQRKAHAVLLTFQHGCAQGNYCIVSGFWNPLLDAEGADDGAFRRLERALHSTTGVEPRCWSEPSYEIESREAQAPTL